MPKPYMTLFSARVEERDDLLSRVHSGTKWSATMRASFTQVERLDIKATVFDHGIQVVLDAGADPDTGGEVSVTLTPDQARRLQDALSTTDLAL